MVTTQLAGPVTGPDTEWFESVYASAIGERTAIPWADGRPSPALVNWLNVVAPSLIRCGARVAVVGCGLGDDARELMRRGYEVTAFDWSPTAITWAQRLDPDNGDCYHVADLFDTPARWRHRFDLVVEINTIQSLDPSCHGGAMAAIAELVSAHGHLLVVCRHASSAPAAGGPPWPMDERELEEIARGAGLTAGGPIAAFLDDEDPPVARMRAVFGR